ncbi:MULTISPECIES: glycosyltransferase family A protein [unclassified Mesorhizobium]|uniref:glycosyltransferase family 2 protein n=1 Tax=unclassified Mesorhizobium TaxID=325217 RepID=UPI000FCAC895|nr:MULTISPECIES: glycosyltransferase family A protein [unclassified Mesorhizobium]TIT80845.1 MAG: glycosyltransferase [Mesorhizobium sp.]TGP23419.1 glycosyltransferase family 2 protein [Mesorhizobium sp. M1D.F.Ca.ET.231.01.1.1]TGP33561.1 glycosyltransferase family 2 protein [Mesorhizobium sp. M1D.F.Ca.ET.234.01.1.1]TGS46928.1 glycosyltransferase family 2 protein [Mesorhizobium sp. M1D.F.Ca.ET.184.01.1.1]TGS62187.1 glycosyltransferase family 2 protein [Mesorhizobium sp. M1D.F.Ca.ET.183.01.1.1]
MADNAPGQPRVTAIIVVFNGERYLREAADSIIGQSLTDWELLVVDDGSTDQSAVIIRDYEQRLPGKVRLLSHHDNRNHGISASRNRGLAEARGTYVAFLDADDTWLPEKLSEQVSIMESDPALGMIYGRTLIWHSWQEAADRADFYYPLGVEPDARYEPPLLFELLLQNEVQTPTTCNALMRASLFETLGAFENSFRLMFEDQTFFAKALAFAPAYVSGRAWAKYRQHSESCSVACAEAGTEGAARITFLKWLNRTMADRGASFRIRAAIWKALARETRKVSERSIKRWLRQWLPCRE